ncbi:patatin-like serine hydrolase [Pochonia chlamydosporia 170]|uniref:Patatin-like serine hydrolase n=1 Tax=Pochonia chlamydosporia 170 TaxID=1380566 RepID=A0A179FUF1_METCM|nr:patatin-like serine hydrolase [Pochonia chlamydosporia 170]OAQ69275.2 patatin-like serine hydrolase [Pochonia chlamydosporia 170]
MLRHNPLKELSFAEARNRCRSCYAGIRLLRGARTRTPGDHVSEWAQAIQNNDGISRFRSCEVKQLLRSSCVQFAQDYTKTFSFQHAWRISPLPGQLTTGVEKLVRLTMHNAATYEAACNTIAGALMQEMYQHRWRTSPCSSAVFSEASFADWFDEFYSPMLGSIDPVTLQSDVKALFLQSSKAKYVQQCSMLKNSQAVLSDKAILPHIDLCLLCLCRFPSNTLSCGHSICDSCMRMGSKKNESDDNTYTMRDCVLCGHTNSVHTILKPPSAGTRVLNLHGDIDEAFPMAMYLKDLRRSILGHFEEYFDLVIGSGIGAFFMIMIFCNQAIIADCIHHIPNLKCIKIDDEIACFGKGLRFPISDLRQAKIKLVLYNTDERLATYKNYIAKSSKWLHKSTTPCQKIDVSNRSYTEALRIWPDDQIRTITQCPNNRNSETLSVANELVSALFYIEREEIPTFYSLSPVVFVLRVKCRLPVGQHLLDVAMRMRRRKVRVRVCMQDYERSFLLCADQMWEALKKGRPFLRRLEVRLCSPKALITVKLDGTVANDTSELCNCPAYAIPCVDTNEYQEISLKEQMNALQETVAQLF